MNHSAKLILLVAVSLIGALSREARAEIVVTKARIGCLDVQLHGNLTRVVRAACGGRDKCTYKAPTPQQYRAAGVRANTRALCTQAMEIIYHCGDNDHHTVMVPGDAWKQPPAELACGAPKAPDPVSATPDKINVRSARIGCLDLQTSGNLSAMVRTACNGKGACAFKAPTEAEYKAAGVAAKTRTFCTQAMEITYDCGRNDPRTAFVQGDAWDHPPARLSCTSVAVESKLDPGEAPIKIVSARIGCLREQKTGNLTRLVAAACDGRAACAYPAPTPDAYARAGVRAKTAALCTQAMEITYRCGAGDDQDVLVPGDAWNHPPARLVCNGKTVATNRQDVTPAQGRPIEPPCKKPIIAAPDYHLAPRDMLDWTLISMEEVARIVKQFTTNSDVFQLLSGFILPKQPTRAQHSGNRAALLREPDRFGGHEGRLREELRKVAAARDPMGALCQAAQRFTRNSPRAGETPSDADFGRAFADLAVTGKASFAAFVRAKPDDAKLKAHAACRGASDAAIKKALDRAYDVANALRKYHLPDAPRKTLGWIAVSGEDDLPYRPVNVPSTKHPQFDVTVTLAKPRISVASRFMIAHRKPPQLAAGAPLVDGGTRKVDGDLVPAIARDAEVILFIHGMDSRVEEADALSKALHGLPDTKNWTVISFDLPTSGYADTIDPARIAPASAVACHNTPVLDFLEDYVVAFVDELDRRTRGGLKPRIRAVVGGSLGGNLSLRLGRRPNTPWVRNIVPWSPAAIWPSYIGQRNAVAKGCDTGWDLFKDRSVHVSLTWSGMDPFFAPSNELELARRALFYGGFDWAPAFGIGGEPPQAQCWLSDKFKCKKESLVAARIDRHETYDRNYRAWHWRLAAEQLAFSHQQFADGTQTPLYLRNHKRTMLVCGYDDTCAGLCEQTREVAGKMTNTPGYARFYKQTGHSLDHEYPNFFAREIAAFLE